MLPAGQLTPRRFAQSRLNRFGSPKAAWFTYLLLRLIPPLAISFLYPSGTAGPACQPELRLGAMGMDQLQPQWPPAEISCGGPADQHVAGL